MSMARIAVSDFNLPNLVGERVTVLPKPSGATIREVGCVLIFLRFVPERCSGIFKITTSTTTHNATPVNSYEINVNRMW